MIDEIYCINIRKRPDRLISFDKDNSAEIMSKLGIDINYTTDWYMNMDGENITPKWLEEHDISKYDNWALKEEQWYEGNARWGWWERDMTNGEIGCAISHSEIWKRAKGTTLILEDDVKLSRNWYAKLYNTLDTLEVIDREWDMIYLGRVPQSDMEINNNTLITSNIKTPLYSFCTYAYMLSSKGLEKINKYEYRKNIIPADEFLSATYAEHPRPIKLLYPPTLKAYAMWPTVAGQNVKLGSDTGDTIKNEKIHTQRHE